jgi:hypothetical protein
MYSPILPPTAQMFRESLRALLVLILNVDQKTAPNAGGTYSGPGIGVLY